MNVYHRCGDQSFWLKIVFVLIAGLLVALYWRGGSGHGESERSGRKQPSPA